MCCLPHNNNSNNATNTIFSCIHPCPCVRFKSSEFLQCVTSYVYLGETVHSSSWEKGIIVRAAGRAEQSFPWNVWKVWMVVSSSAWPLLTWWDPLCVCESECACVLCVHPPPLTGFCRVLQTCDLCQYVWSSQRKKPQQRRVFPQVTWSPLLESLLTLTDAPIWCLLILSLKNQALFCVLQNVQSDDLIVWRNLHIVLLSLCLHSWWAIQLQCDHTCDRHRCAHHRPHRPLCYRYPGVQTHPQQPNGETNITRRRIWNYRWPYSIKRRGEHSGGE